MSSMTTDYGNLGFVVRRDLLPHAAIDRLMGEFLSLANRLGGSNFRDPHSPAFAMHLNERKDIQSRVYDAIRQQPWLEELSVEPALTDAAGLLVERPISLLKKVVFRIDAPMETAQLAVWHQDNYYVRGNTSIVTAWIPMQDTTFVHGCLQLMPESHRLGPVPHNVELLGKRHLPTGIFEREVRFVEMQKGDVLFFHSCLLHSSGMNFSEVARYSVQARYSPVGEPTDPGMGGVRAI